jgi:hypothetical protein
MEPTPTPTPTPTPKTPPANPFEVSSTNAVTPPSTGPALSNSDAARHGYNIVTDTVTGANFRKSDNFFQLIVIAGFIVVFAPLGAYFASSTSSPDSKSGAMLGGALAGTLAALIVGVLSSGVILMVYRGIQHLRGKHD